MTTSNEFVTDPGAGRDTVRAVARVDPPGIELHDDIHGHSESLLTPEPVSLTECDTDPFCFPVDRAYRVTYPDGCAPALVIQQVANVFVRDDEAQQVAEAVNRGSLRVGKGDWTVEIDSLGIKIYVHVEGALQSSIDDDSCRRLHFPDAAVLRIGIRSLHEQPAATIGVGTSPRAVMRAVSCFGSALKTPSPERSFPTLRGHPPLIEVDEDADPEWFDAPAGIERTPDSADVIVRVPEQFGAIYPVASLAYYLDAAVVPGEPALLTADTLLPLTGPSAVGTDLEESAARILEMVFTLDCVTRTEGFYRIQLSERDQIEAAIEAFGTAIDWAELYDATLGERVARYLSLPYDVVASVVPRWPVTAHVEPTPDNAEFLPFIADALGSLRTVEDERPRVNESVTDAQQVAVSDFLRNGSDTDQTDDGAGAGEGTAAGFPPVSERTITVPRTDAITDLWCAPGHPIGGAEPTINSCQRRLAANPSGTIDVAVVSNSPAMRAEDDVSELYGIRELLTFDVSLYEDLSADALQGVFAADHDLVHFVGHVSERGLQTADGWLNARELPPESIRTRAFVLNACRSYGQGRALVNAGAIGGLCTISPIGNSPATHVGRTVARLLNVGFTLGAALDIIRNQTITGGQYSIVGDPRVVIAKGRGGTPYRAHIDRTGNDRYRVEIHCYASLSLNLGTMFIPFLGDNEERYLNSGLVSELTVTREALESFLALERFPVTFENDSTLYWSWEIQAMDISEIAGN